MQRKEVIARLRAKFVVGPVLTIALRHMHIQFDPRNLKPLAGDGTVDPTMHIVDDWGILDVTDGALMKSDWSAVVVAAPAAFAGARLTGEGWTLELKPGWKVAAGAKTGDFLLEASG